MNEDLAVQIHEVADEAVNPDGYADDPVEADRRSQRRDELERLIRAVVTAYTGG